MSDIIFILDSRATTVSIEALTFCFLFWIRRRLRSILTRLGSIVGSFHSEQLWIHSETEPWIDSSKTWNHL